MSDETTPTSVKDAGNAATATSEPPPVAAQPAHAGGGLVAAASEAKPKSKEVFRTTWSQEYIAVYSPLVVDAQIMRPGVSAVSARAALATATALQLAKITDVGPSLLMDKQRVIMVPPELYYFVRTQISEQLAIKPLVARSTDASFRLRAQASRVASSWIQQHERNGVANGFESNFSPMVHHIGNDPTVTTLAEWKSVVVESLGYWACITLPRMVAAGSRALIADEVAAAQLAAINTGTGPSRVLVFCGCAAVAVKCATTTMAAVCANTIVAPLLLGSEMCCAPQPESTGAAIVDLIWDTIIPYTIPVLSNRGAKRQRAAEVDEVNGKRQRNSEHGTVSVSTQTTTSRPGDNPGQKQNDTKEVPPTAPQSDVKGQPDALQQMEPSPSGSLHSNTPENTDTGSRSVDWEDWRSMDYALCPTVDDGADVKEERLANPDFNRNSPVEIMELSRILLSATRAQESLEVHSLASPAPGFIDRLSTLLRRVTVGQPYQSLASVAVDEVGSVNFERPNPRPASVLGLLKQARAPTSSDMDEERTYGSRFGPVLHEETLIVEYAKYDYTVQVMQDYRERGGTFQDSISGAFWCDAMFVSGNPNLVPFYAGVDSQHPAKDTLSSFEYLCKSNARTWKPRHQSGMMFKDSKKQIDTAGQMNFCEVKGMGTPVQKWFHVGLLSFDTPVMGFRSSFHNYLLGVQRHYGTDISQCPHRPSSPDRACEMCVHWSTAIAHMNEYWLEYALDANAWLDDQNLLGGILTPCEVTHNMRFGKDIGKVNVALQGFDVITWYSLLDAPRRRRFGQDVDKYLSGEMVGPFWAAMTNFPKWEKYSSVTPGKSVAAKLCRLVCPAKNPGYNMVSGTAFLPLSKALISPFRTWLLHLSQNDATEIPDVCITSGSTCVEIGTWFMMCVQLGYDIFIELDQSGFDSRQNAWCSHVTRHVFNLFHATLRGGSVPHANVMRDDMIRRLSCRKVRLYDGSFEYRDGNCSGQGGTFQQNTIVNSTAVFGTIKAQIEAMAGSFAAESKFLGLGDDCLVGMRGLRLEEVRDLLSETVRRVTVMGLSPSPVLSPVPSFCSAIFWPIVVKGVETYVLGPELGRHFSRSGACFNWSKPSMTKGEALSIMLGVVQSNVHWCYLPVLRIFSRCVLNAAQLPGRARVVPLYLEEEHKSKQVEDVGFALSARCGQFMHDVYGLDLGEVRELESFIHEVCVASGCVSAFISHPLLTKMAHRYAQVRSS